MKGATSKSSLRAEMTWPREDSPRERGEGHSLHTPESVVKLTPPSIPILLSKSKMQQTLLLLLSTIALGSIRLYLPLLIIKREIIFK